MAYKFNPFTGKLDQVGAGGGGGTPGGSDTQVQFNDGGTFGGDAGLTYNKTTDELTLAGDLNLDDGGTYTTTIQAVTPTQDRTISFPDATGTVALVAGSNQAVQYNSAGTNAGDSGLLYDATSGSLTVGGKTVTTDAPVINLSQTWNNAGTTFTGLKLNVTNTASATGSNLLDLQSGGTSQFRVAPNGLVVFRDVPDTKIQLYSNYTIGIAPFAFTFTSDGANSLNPSAIFFNREGGTPTECLRLLFHTTEAGIRLGNSGDTILVRDNTSNTLAQRNSTNAQTFRLYNTYTDASNYERGFFQWNSNVLEIGSEGLGTGSEQPVRITAATLKLPNLPTYADNAAASAVLAVGDVYKTATGELRIVV